MGSDRIQLEEDLLEKMITYFGDDARRICHARKVLKYAKELRENEGGNENVIVAAAILHDIGIKECERKYHSSGGQLQEKEGPPIARKILEVLEVGSEIIDEICGIIGSHHSPGEVDSLNFQIIWDADWLVNLRDEYKMSNRNKLEKIIEKIFMTRSGKMLAKEVYLRDEKR